MKANRLKAAALLLTPLMFIVLATHAATVERTTPTEAQAMLQKAIAHYKAVGRKQALADFSDGCALVTDTDLALLVPRARTQRFEGPHYGRSEAATERQLLAVMESYS